MMRRTIPLIAILAAMLVAVPAGASTTDAIARDCQRSSTGELRGTYTKAELRHALNNLPSDVSEYSDCYDQIYAALHANDGDGADGGGNDGQGGGATGGGATSGSTGGGAGGGVDGGSAGAPPVGTPHVGTKQAVKVGGAAVQPGTIPALGQDAHKLPTPLLAFLALLTLSTLVPLATTIVRRVLARRRI